MDLLEATCSRERTLLRRLNETCQVDLIRGEATLLALRRTLGILLEMGMPVVVALEEVGENRLSDDLYVELCALVEESRSLAQDAETLRTWATARLRPFYAKAIEEVDRVRRQEAYRHPIHRPPSFRG